MTLDETVESYIGLVDMFFKQFLIYPYIKDTQGKVFNAKDFAFATPFHVLAQRAAFEVANRDCDNVKQLFIFIGNYLSGIITKEGVRQEIHHNLMYKPGFDSKFREYCLLQMQKYHSTRDEAMYTVSKLDEFTPFSYEEVDGKHILKYLKTGGIIEPIKR